MGTECEACGKHFDLVTGGICTRCRRVLCARHLHGSFTRRVLVDLGARPVCVTCRLSGNRGAEEEAP
jgi:hypothetical protein